MIAATARYTQNLTKFIQMTGAANIGWTEAGLIAGNDPYNGANAWKLHSRERGHPVRMDRFYKPLWVAEAEQMYAELDRTRILVMSEREGEFQFEMMIAIARIQGAENNLAPMEVFELEWDD